MNIAILGGGAWASTLAVHLHKNGHQISIWEFDKQRLDYLKKHRHPLFFPHLKLDDKIVLTNDIGVASVGKDIVVLVVPTQNVRETIKKIKNHKDQIFVIASKGIEITSGKLLSEIVKEELDTKNIVVLSGPSFAKEVAKSLPTVIVAAGDKKNAGIIQKIFTSLTMRVYTNTDITGVEIGGAIKNVIAVACGIARGMGFGDNTIAAIVTRGLAEITRFGIKLGAKKETFFGLTGMGDLVMTSFSKNSRNESFGEFVGSGLTPKDAEKKIGMVVEGVPTTQAVVRISRQLKIEMPITNEVHKIIFEGKNPKEALLSLMSREVGPE